MIQRPWLGLLFAIALIVMSAYTINTYNKDPRNSATAKIVVDIFAVVFIIAGIAAGVAAVKAMRK